MTLPGRDYVVEAFPSDRADQPLSVAVLPWRSAAFSASSRPVDLNSEISKLRNKDSSATIAGDGYVILLSDQTRVKFSAHTKRTASCDSKQCGLIGFASLLHRR
jgi:hypothetical protein